MASPIIISVYCPKVISRAAGLEIIITIAQFAIFYKDFLIVSKHTQPFEERHWGSSPLFEKGGFGIVTDYISVSFVYTTYPCYWVVI